MLLEKLDLEPGEDILKVVRKHWFVIFTHLLSIGVLAIAPLILFGAALAVPALLGKSVSLSQYSSVFIFMFSGWLLFCLLTGFVAWTHYYLDLWIITDRRIITVEQKHFFNRSVAIFRLERLQDIEFKIKGLVATFFNYGILSAQTAGHMEANFNSDHMPHPDQLQAIIQKAMDARLTELNSKPHISAPLESAGE